MAPSKKHRFDPANDPAYEKVWCEWCRNWRFRCHAEEHDRKARAEIERRGTRW